MKDHYVSGDDIAIFMCGSDPSAAEPDDDPVTAGDELHDAEHVDPQMWYYAVIKECVLRMAVGDTHPSSVN